MAMLEAEFNTVQFEKKLIQLKDSQDSINSLSAWCLEHRQHHKKIVSAWLNVLKRVKIEHRLTLFYLANDVIQYSKRKNYEFVESWGTTLQKATTMVREEKVKHRVLRIFKIWEQRGIYGEEFLSDLSGLISAAPAKKTEHDPLEFQPSYLISKIQACSKLEEDTDVKLKKVKDNEQKPHWQDSEGVLFSLKDRQQVEDVEKEVENGVKLVENVMNALNTEIKARKHLLNLLAQAEAFYRTQKGEVKVVANAYKNFGGRVKTLKKRLDELMQDTSRWASPVPSPDVNAPSPEPDSDTELPGDINSKSMYSLDRSYTANFYNPVQAMEQSQSFSKGFSSFIGTNMPFDIHANIFNDSNTPSLVSDTNSTNNLIEVVGGNQQQSQTNEFSLNNIIKQLIPGNDRASNNMNTNMDPNSHIVYGDVASNNSPLQPPPMPPFTSPGATYIPSNNMVYSEPVYPPTTNTYTHTAPPMANYQQPPPYTIPPNQQTQPPPYQFTTDEYNPEEEPETWDNDGGVWPEPPDLETPESPPGFEKEAQHDPIEYNDVVVSQDHGVLAAQDVDHRVLLPPPMPRLQTQLGDIKGTDSDHRLGRSGAKDVDHRNLISLTGSPNHETKQDGSVIPPPPLPPNLWGSQVDQDYRIPPRPALLPTPPLNERDFQKPPPNINPVPMMNFAQLAAEPPPPPPPLQRQNSQQSNKLRTPVKRASAETSQLNHDNVESIDMDLSDDDTPQMNISTNKGMSEPEEKKRKQFGEGKTLEPPPTPPVIDSQEDSAVNDLLDNIETDIMNEDNFYLQEDMENGNDQVDRNWYQNEWGGNNGPSFQNPPDFQNRAMFQHFSEFPPPQEFNFMRRGNRGGRGFAPPFRGRGGQWNNNRQPRGRGNNRGFPRGNNRGNFRARGGPGNRGRF